MTTDDRTQGIGASEIAAVLGLSPWGSPFSVWASKVGLPTIGNGYRPGDAEERMRWGQLLELPIAAEFTTRTGLDVVRVQERVTHPNVPIAFATLDGITEPDRAVLEIKTTSDREWDAVPEHYQIQVQYQMACAGLDAAYVACLHAGQKLSIWQLDADHGAQNALLRAAQAFWDTYVVPATPPPVDGHPYTSKALTAAYRTSQPHSSVEIDDATALAVTALRQIKNKIREWEAKRALVEQQIQAVLTDTEDGTYNDAVIVTWREQTATRLDTRALKEERPDIWHEYARTDTHRVLRTPGGDDD